MYADLEKESLIKNNTNSLRPGESGIEVLEWKMMFICHNILD